MSDPHVDVVFGPRLSHGRNPKDAKRQASRGGFLGSAAALLRAGAAVSLGSCSCLKAPRPMFRQESAKKSRQGRWARSIVYSSEEYFGKRGRLGCGSLQQGLAYQGLQQKVKKIELRLGRAWSFTKPKYNLIAFCCNPAKHYIV